MIFKTCKNCKMELSHWNKTDFCSSWCEMKLTGVIEQQSYKQPIKAVTVKTVEKKQDWIKEPIPMSTDYILAVTDGNIFKLENPNEKHPSVVLSFHERFQELLTIKTEI